MSIHIHGHVTGTGVGTYQENLKDALRAMGHDVVATTPTKKEWIIAGKRVGGFISQTVSGFFTPKDPDSHVMHAVSNWVYPFASDSVMVHDLNPLVLRGWTSSRAMFRRQKQRLRRSVLLTPSEAIRQFLAFWLKVDADTITVAPNAVDTDFYQPNGHRTGGYVLSVGDYRDYKRVEDVVDIAERLGLSVARVGPKANDKYGRWVKEYAADKIGGRFHDYGYVTKDFLRKLYSNAEALVFTSRHEGFGIPPLEAAACGTPSVLADTPVNREIHGDAAVYASDIGLVGLREIQDLQDSPALYLNANRHTWDHCARQHLVAWRDLRA